MDESNKTIAPCRTPVEHTIKDHMSVRTMVVHCTHGVCIDKTIKILEFMRRFYMESYVSVSWEHVGKNP